MIWRSISCVCKIFLLQYCTSDKRKRRSVDEEINDGTGDYLYTKITVIDPEGNKQR